jgi:hypothetical protein
MGTKAKTLVTLALASTCAVLALPTTASAAARSGVTIHNFIADGLKGFVFSPKPAKCADGRTVKVFRQTGKAPNPKRDIKVAKTNASADGHGKYKWKVGLHRPRPGHYYARVPATAACQADNSKAIRISARPRTKITNTILNRNTRSAEFQFSVVGGVGPYRARCKLDDKPYRPCKGPESYSHLSRGHHVFKVFEIGSNGRRDRTPAKRGFHFSR